VFVADSQAPMQDANLESISNLKVNLAEMGLTIDEVPMVFQYNKRDLRNILALEPMNAALNPEGRPYFEAAAVHGIGVFETLKGIVRLAIASVREKVGPDAIWPKSPAGSEPVDEPVLELSALDMPALEVTPPRALNPDGLESAAAPAPPAADEPEIEIEFAEEPVGNQDVRAVRTRGALDIEAELQKLRAMTVSATRRAPAPESPGRSAIDKRLQDMIGTHGTRQDVKRKASVEVPGYLLKESGTLRVHLAFEGPGPEEIVRDAVIIRLGPSQKLERLTLHIDLDVKGKPPGTG
jgi:hypothetical protein